MQDAYGWPEHDFGGIGLLARVHATYLCEASQGLGHGLIAINVDVHGTEFMTRASGPTARPLDVWGSMNTITVFDAFGWTLYGVDRCRSVSVLFIVKIR